MDTSQPYLPLSHALNPPSTSTSPYPQQSASNTGYNVRPHPDDDDDEGAIEQQLNQDRTSQSPTEKTDGNAHGPPHDDVESPSGGTKKRGPGRPKGSRTKKRADPPPPPVAGSSSFGATPPAQPPHPTGRTGGVTPENQAYYEFQWRILNLCMEFYGAAEELVRGTSPTVIAQSYQMGPNSVVDPLALLSDAKRTVDTLMANPTQLLNRPPPALPTASNNFQIPTSHSFVLPLNPRGSTPKVKAAPANPSYQPFSSGGSAVTSSSAAVAAAVASIQNSHHHSNPSASSHSAQVQGAKEGHWSDEEMEKLKSLAQTSRAKMPNGDIDWDHVVNGFGGTRTKHQILIKGTALGLKESSSKSTKSSKRKRENADSDGAPARPNPPTVSVSPPIVAQPSAQPPSGTTTMSSFRYTMPVIASADGPPNGTQGDGQTGGSFYRPRPTSSSTGNTARTAAHPFMYQPER